MKFRSYISGLLVLFLSLCFQLFTFNLHAAGLIVKYKNSSPPSLRQNTIQQINISKSYPLTDSQTEVLELDPSQSSHDAIEKLRQNESVEYVEEDSIISAHSTPNDSFFSQQWALEGNPANVNVEKAWDYVTSSNNVLIALVDSGCNYNHEDLRDNVWRNPEEIPENGIDDDHDGFTDDVYGYDFKNSDPDPFDDYEHGTMVFGIIGANGNNGKGISGINWNAKIMCLKVLDSEGNSTISKAVSAINFAIDHKAKIINMSWGYTPYGDPSRTLEDAIRRAKDAGILVVASAGNGSGTSSTGINNDENLQNANYPSSYSEDNIIAVAATDTHDQLPFFSNYGTDSVDLAAPGVGIYSTHPTRRYDYFTGTSAAAPHVTGAAALIWSFNPDLSYSEVKRLILETTDPQSSLSGKTLTGGRLNIGKAIEASPAAGGHLLESPSTLPSANQSGNANGTSDADISSQSGGCSFNKNSKQTHPVYILLLFFTAGIFFTIRKEKKKN